MAAIIATCSWKVIMATLASIRVGRVVHDELTASLLASTFRWLDVTPVSRIVARCTQDIQALDGALMHSTTEFVALVVMCASRLVAIALYAPVYILPALVIGLVGLVLGQMYIRAQLSVKRERSIAKAPVLAAVDETFSGLTSIRAFNAQTAFIASSMKKIDNYTHLSIIFRNLTRWITIRIQLLAAVFITGLAFYLVYGPGHEQWTAGSVGFLLSMAVGFSNVLLWIVRVFDQLEIEANSLERIQSYLEIEKETGASEGGILPAYWPASGDLQVQNLTARYSPDGPIVLDKISLQIKAGERVAVVGRTGSGKSTFTLALLRCIFTEGEVFYDGAATSGLNLDALRRAITIIPQAPELLRGTIRKNLNMFGQHDDAELHDAIRSAGLFAGADESRLTLDSAVAAGGANLSVGQRQIIALARALVRRSKLLVVDEATSAIDYDMDATIQAALRTGLPRDVTVITVAHRLQTVADADKILVLDAGKLAEFDSPKNLLARDGGFFRTLVDESSDKEALYTMAQRKV